MCVYVTAYGYEAFAHVVWCISRYVRVCHGIRVWSIRTCRVCISIDAEVWYCIILHGMASYGMCRYAQRLPANASYLYAVIYGYHLSDFGYQILHLSHRIYDIACMRLRDMCLYTKHSLISSASVTYGYHLSDFGYLILHLSHRIYDIACMRLRDTRLYTQHSLTDGIYIRDIRTSHTPSITLHLWYCMTSICILSFQRCHLYPYPSLSVSICHLSIHIHMSRHTHLYPYPYVKTYPSLSISICHLYPYPYPRRGRTPF